MFKLAIGMMSAMSRRCCCYCCCVKVVVMATLKEQVVVVIVVNKSKKKDKERERKKKEKKNCTNARPSGGNVVATFLSLRFCGCCTAACLGSTTYCINCCCGLLLHSTHPPPSTGLPPLFAHTHLPLPLLNLSG